MSHWFRNTVTGNYFGVVYENGKYRRFQTASKTKPMLSPAEMSSAKVTDVPKAEALDILRANYSTGWEE